jgi:hypothetical protein
VEESFDGIATVLNVVLKKKLVVELDGQDVALMMMSLKLCREANEHSWDNLVDLAGYAALKGQLAESTRAKAKTEFEDEIRSSKMPLMRSRIGSMRWPLDSGVRTWVANRRVTTRESLQRKEVSDGGNMERCG